MEVDGKQDAAEAEYDARRSEEIERQGLSVIRVTNRQVRERLDDVIALIAAALRLE